MLTVRFEYINTEECQMKFERLVKQFLPSVELTVEGGFTPCTLYRADSDDPLDFYKLGMIHAMDIAERKKMEAVSAKLQKMVQEFSGG